MRFILFFAVLISSVLFYELTIAGEWVKCADENGYCSFQGKKKVRYGADSRWHYLTLAGGGTPCNNQTFGDPAYGTVKRCYYYKESSYYWKKCADENGHCSFYGKKKVRYGANGVYAYRVLEDGAYCTNHTFGDPIYGTVKACYIMEKY
ncbi:MAG: hypothetical protein D3913_03505 [Candidatus Electrothrix sp. LOE1_4_5]|nr:hypothetical protein [Candidatus Electrothrix gigas]MCI5178952.1 hypothetical protein [Candidatus Electrothrix gigas]MCI5226526.1 hypothetical protein [Candidatus Electrothrix gigas]